MPHDNYPGESGQHLGVSQIILASLTLIAGIVQASIASGVWLIAPALYFVAHLACGILGVFAGQRKTESLIYSNMAVNIVIVILFSFNQLFYGMALSFVSGVLSDWVNFDASSVDAYVAMSVLICLMGLAQIIVSIWSASLGCCCSQATRGAVVAAYPAGGQVMYTAQNQGQVFVTAPGYQQAYIQSPSYVQQPGFVQQPVFVQQPGQQTFAPGYSQPAYPQPLNTHGRSAAGPNIAAPGYDTAGPSIPALPQEPPPAYGNASTQQQH